jgi:hypothetical protein
VLGRACGRARRPLHNGRGVAGDVHLTTLVRDPEPAVYFPLVADERSGGTGGRRGGTLLRWRWCSGRT